MTGNLRIIYIRIRTNQIVQIKNGNQSKSLKGASRFSVEKNEIFELKILKKSFRMKLNTVSDVR